MENPIMSLCHKGVGTKQREAVSAMERELGSAFSIVFTFRSEDMGDKLKVSPEYTICNLPRALLPMAAKVLKDIAASMEKIHSAANN